MCAQGYLAMDVVRRNNEELIKGVDRAATTTVSALRIAVMLASALDNQRKVIEQVNTLRGTTEDLIRGNAEMLATQSGEIQRIAADPAVGAETLRAAFQQIYRTLDAIDTYKVQATEAMAATVESLTAELQAASAYLERTPPANALEGGPRHETAHRDRPRRARPPCSWPAPPGAPSRARSPPRAADDAYRTGTLRVLACSELSDMKPVLDAGREGHRGHRAARPTGHAGRRRADHVGHVRTGVTTPSGSRPTTICGCGPGRGGAGRLRDARDDVAGRDRCEAADGTAGSAGSRRTSPGPGAPRPSRTGS